MLLVRSLFLFLFVITISISGVSPKTCKEDGKFAKSFALAVLQQLKLPNAAVQGKYIMNVIYLILIKLDFVLQIKVSPYLVLKSIFVFEYFAPLTPFLFTTFPAFYYYPTSLSRDTCIKNNHGHQNSINSVNDGVARKVSL